MANAAVNLSANSGITNEEDDKMNLLDKKEHENVGYQENLRIYVKNIENIKTIWRTIYEVINVTFSCSFLSKRFILSIR